MSVIPSPIIDASLFLDQNENGGRRSKEYYEITTFVQTTGTSKFFNYMYPYNKRINTLKRNNHIIQKYFNIIGHRIKYFDAIQNTRMFVSAR